MIDVSIHRSFLYVERAIAAAVVICLFVFIYLFEFLVCHMRRFSDKKCDLRLASTIVEKRRTFFFFVILT